MSRAILQNIAVILAAAEAEISKGDIILRTFIGMVFIMLLMFLAVIVTGGIGRLREKQLNERCEHPQTGSDSGTQLQSDESTDA